MVELSYFILYDVPVGFVTPAPILRLCIALYICGRRRVAVARYRMICLVIYKCINYASVSHFDWYVYHNLLSNDLDHFTLRFFIIIATNGLCSLSDNHFLFQRYTEELTGRIFTEKLQYCSVQGKSTMFRQIVNDF